ncbi:MAG: mechanosensitive ion channel [Planctomycetaceae bacterium]|nr:mechanosensitive ion channel [Planctomycetaceae bacterium]
MHASQFAFLLIQESFESSAPETTAVAEGTAAVPSTGSGPFLHNVWQNIRSNFNTETVAETLMNWGPPLVSAIAVFILGRMISRVMSGMIVKGSRRAKIDETLARFLGNLAYIMMLTAVCIASLGCLGVDTTSLSAVLAAAGFAVGMALQGSLGNVAAGVLLVFFKPFKVGDLIDVGGTLGKVVEIQIFNTILLSPDNVRIVLPNSSITGGTIRNMSAEPIRRVDLVIGCSYNDDLRAVRAFLEEVVKADSRILLDPAPVVAVSELAESSVNFVVRPWVASADYGNVKFALTEAIKLGFDERGFTIPFPSRDVFVHHSGNVPLSVIEGAAAAAAA